MKLIEQIKADRMVAFKAKENIKKYFKETYPGQYDGKLLSTIAKELLK